MADDIEIQFTYKNNIQPQPRSTRSPFQNVGQYQQIVGKLLNLSYSSRYCLCN